MNTPRAALARWRCRLLSVRTVRDWLSRIDKDSREERDAAIMSLYLQCFAQEEIAAAIGMPQQSVADILPRIREYGIPVIPGIFTEDAPGDTATDKQIKEFEELRQLQISGENQSNAEHEAADFEPPLYNIYPQRSPATAAGIRARPWAEPRRCQ